jgi:hypothetical protein
MEMNRQLVQRVLARDEKPAAPAVDPTQAEIAEAVRNRDFATLAKHGITAQDWADATMADLTDDPKEKELLQLKREVEAQRQWRETQEKRQQEQELKAKRDHVQRIETETKDVIRQTLADDPETKLVLALAQGVDAVYSVIEKHVLETQRIYGQPQWLDPREAAKIVLKDKGPEIGRLLEVAKEHPNYRAYFAASAQTTEPVSQSPSPATTISSNQVRGSAGVAAQDTLQSREAAVLRVIEAYAKQR